jgi:hypothetical protein
MEYSDLYGIINATRMSESKIWEHGDFCKISKPYTHEHGTNLYMEEKFNITGTVLCDYSEKYKIGTLFVLMDKETREHYKSIKQQLFDQGVIPKELLDSKTPRTVSIKNKKGSQDIKLQKHATVDVNCTLSISTDMFGKQSISLSA